jgi:hypothetical protein
VLSPSGTTGNTTPTITWRVVDGAARYDLWVDQLGGQSQIIREQNLTTTSFTPTTPLACTGNYRIWVRAISTTDEDSDWSIPLDFTIADNGVAPPATFHDTIILTVLSPLPTPGGEGQGEGAATHRATAPKPSHLTTSPTNPLAPCSTRTTITSSQ